MSQSYKQAGVDIEAGNLSVRKIKRLAETTFGKGDLAGIGGFSSAFALDLKEYDDPVLISGTDGVGTKLLLTVQLEKYETIGIDLVAMCVNDILTTGAQPLFFQDYIACAKVEPWKIEQIVAGICEGCRQSGCSLNGGEVAEMPDLYGVGHYDLAGFCVGAVNRNEIPDKTAIRPGDCLVGIASSGIHSNGFSLARKVLGIGNQKPNDSENRRLLEELLTPTKIYVPSVRFALKNGIRIKSLTHITGGGFYENLPRSLPEGIAFRIEKVWPVPPVFQRIQSLGKIPPREMFTVFNMGIGMVAVVEPDQVKPLLDCLEEKNEKAWQIGTLFDGSSSSIEGVD